MIVDTLALPQSCAKALIYYGRCDLLMNAGTSGCGKGSKAIAITSDSVQYTVSLKHSGV